MADVLLVQASGAMFDTAEPPAWCPVFGVFVTDREGTPIPGLKKKNFVVWRLSSSVGEVPVRMVTELVVDFPSSEMPGMYRVQADQILGLDAPAPHGFVFAIRVTAKRRKAAGTGMTTVPITYFGKPR